MKSTCSSCTFSLISRLIWRLNNATSRAELELEEYRMWLLQPVLSLQGQQQVDAANAALRDMLFPVLNLHEQQQGDAANASWPDLLLQNSERAVAARETAQHDIQRMSEALDAVELAIEAAREPAAEQHEQLDASADQHDQHTAEQHDAAAEQLAQLTDEQKLAMCKPKSLGCQTPAGIQGAAIGTRLPKAVPSQAPRMAPANKAAGTAQSTNAAAASTERSNVAAAPTQIHVELKPPPGAKPQRPKLKPGQWMNSRPPEPISPPQRWRPRPPTKLRTKNKTSGSCRKSRSSSSSWGWWHRKSRANQQSKQSSQDTAAQSSQDTAAESSQDADDDAAAIGSGGAATADELAAVYIQGPDPDAEIQEALYSALSRSWLSRADVDPVLGTIIRHARTRNGASTKPAAKVRLHRGKRNRAGSAL